MKMPKYRTDITDVVALLAPVASEKTAITSVMSVSRLGVNEK